MRALPRGLPIPQARVRRPSGRLPRRARRHAGAELRRRCRRNTPESIRTATVYYKPSRNRSAIQPNYCVHKVEDWLVFPHELQGLSREEILQNKPVGAEFFDAK